MYHVKFPVSSNLVLSPPRHTPLNPGTLANTSSRVPRNPDPGLLTHSVYVCPDTKETGTATKKLLGCDLWLGAEQSTDRAVDLSVGHLLSFCNNIINESEAKKKENKHTFDKVGL